MADLQKEFNAYTKNLNKASKDENIKKAITRAVKSYRETTAETMERFPHTPEMAAEVREINEEVYCQ